MRILAVVLFMLGIGSAATASNEGASKSLVSVKVVDQQKALFRYKSLPDGPVWVKIYDSNNRLIKRQQIDKGSAFAKYYDYSKLAPGNYTFEILENQNPVERFAVSFPSAEKSAPVVFSKLEKKDGNSFKLLYNALLPSDLTIQVYENGLMLHEEKISDVASFDKLYKFKGVSPTARLDFLISTEDGFFKRLVAN